MISQKTPSGKSVLSIVCGEKHKDYSEDLPENNTEEASEINAEGSSKENAELEEPADHPEEEEEDDLLSDPRPDEWDEFIVNRKESYVLTGGKWLDLTSSEGCHGDGSFDNS